MMNWRRVQRGLQIALALNVGVAVWLVGFRSDSAEDEILPTTDSVFSLDLEVVASVDSDLVYVLEQRSQPNYRVFSFNPATGETTTVWSVPEGALVFGMALAPDGESLALAYTPDHSLEGSGLWTLELVTGSLTQVAASRQHRYFADLAWSADGQEVLATSIEYTTAGDVLSSIGIDATTGQIRTIAADTINPVEIDGVAFVLELDEEQARRSIGSVDQDGGFLTISRHGDEDLDHLTADVATGSLSVAVLESQDDGLTIGDAAWAHGSHQVPSTWSIIDTTDGSETPGALDAMLIHDAIARDGEIVTVTDTGLWIETSESRTHLIESRALRFVAG